MHYGFDVIRLSIIFPISRIHHIEIVTVLGVDVAKKFLVYLKNHEKLIFHFEVNKLSIKTLSKVDHKSRFFVFPVFYLRRTSTAWSRSLSKLKRKFFFRLINYRICVLKTKIKLMAEQVKWTNRVLMIWKKYIYYTIFNSNWSHLFMPEAEWMNDFMCSCIALLFSNKLDITSIHDLLYF